MDDIPIKGNRKYSSHKSSKHSQHHPTDKIKPAKQCVLFLDVTGFQSRHSCDLLWIALLPARVIFASFGILGHVGAAYIFFRTTNTDSLGGVLGVLRRCRREHNLAKVTSKTRSISFFSNWSGRAPFSLHGCRTYKSSTCRGNRCEMRYWIKGTGASSSLL